MRVAGIILVLLLCWSCEKEYRRHGIKAIVKEQATGQPVDNKKVYIGYYTPSSGMGILTLNGPVGEGFTNSEGYFDIRFPVKEYQLREGHFNVKIEYMRTMTQVTTADLSLFSNRRIVDLGTVYVD